jgi:Rrf2 family protein
MVNSFISREQDYALRITAFLANADEGKFVSVTEIAKRLLISRKFSARIVHKLTQAGILKTERGKQGGAALKKSPSKISLFEILNTIGFKVRFNACVHDSYDCPLEELCQFHKLWKSEEDRFFDTLRNSFIENYKLSLKP